MTLQQLIDSNGFLISGDKRFAAFGFTGDTALINPANIEVEVPALSGGCLGLRFRGGMTATGSAVDFALRYSVETISGLPLLTQIGQSLTFSGSGDIAIGESVWTAGFFSGSVAQSSIGTSDTTDAPGEVIQGDDLIIDPPDNKVWVTKDVLLTPTGTVTLETLDQVFCSGPVTEDPDVPVVFDPGNPALDNPSVPFFDDPSNLVGPIPYRSDTEVVLLKKIVALSGGAPYCPCVWDTFQALLFQWAQLACVCSPEPCVCSPAPAPAPGDIDGDGVVEEDEGLPPPPGACPGIVALDTAEDFAILGASTVTNTGLTVINGDLGLSPGSSVTGFPPGVVNGTQHIANAIAAQAQLDLTTAYLDAEGRPGGTPVAGDIGGQTLGAGVYKSTSSLEVSSGNLTLDGGGDACAVFLFQIASTLLLTTGRQILLTNGASAKNVFWQVGSSGTFQVSSGLKGTVMALASITAETNAVVEGRLLARNGAVTLDTNTVTVPV